MTKKMFKRAILGSLVSLIFYCTMLIGTTYAWFTDEVTSSGNRIEAGVLDVELQMFIDGTFVEVGEYSSVFGNSEIWEPGYSEMAVLKVVNSGSLALEWKLEAIVEGEITATPDGTSTLGDVIDVYYKIGAVSIPASFEEAIQTEGYVYAGTLSQMLAEEDGAAHGVLLPNVVAEEGEPAATEDDPAQMTAPENTDPVGEVTAGIILHMREGVCNDYQGLKIGDRMDIILTATQYDYESDSFGADYDANADVEEGSEGSEGGESTETNAVGTESFAAGENGVYTLNLPEAESETVTYALSGDFTGEKYVITVPADSNVVIDGANATFTNASNIKFTFGRIADGMATISEEGGWLKRSGSYTVQNFNVPEGTLSIGASSTAITVDGCTTKGLDIDGSNCTIHVTDNTFHSEGESLPRYDNSGNDKSFYMSAVNYDLTLTGNILSNTKKDTISINGRGEWDMADYNNNQADGSIDKSSIRNSITLDNNTLTAARRALYVWGDHTYGSNYTLTGESTAADLSAEAKALVAELLTEDVTLTGASGESTFAGFGGLYLDRAACGAIQTAGNP